MVSTYQLPSCKQAIFRNGSHKLVSNTKYQPQLTPYKAFCVQLITDNIYTCLYIFTYFMATKGHATCCPFHEMHFNPTNNSHCNGIVGESWFHFPDSRQFENLVSYPKFYLNILNIVTANYLYNAYQHSVKDHQHTLYSDGPLSSTSVLASFLSVY